MIRYIVVVAASVGLILLTSIIVGRLIRSRRRGLSIRMQVFLALATIIGSFALGLGLLVVERVEARARRLALDAAEDEARIIVALLQSELKQSEIRLESLIERLLASGTAHENAQTRKNEELRFATNKPLKSQSTDIFRQVGVEILSLDGRLLFPRVQSSRALEEGSVFFDRFLFHDEKKVALVRVVKPTIVIETMLADFAPSVLILSLILGASAAFAATLIGRAIALPIEELRRYSYDVSRGERAAPPALAWGREVSHLVSSIETMRKRLEGRPFVETFAADLSHELKNPVAAIRASAEVLAEGALDERDEAERFVARITEAATRIELLLEELLSLAQIEARGVEQLEQVNLGRLARQVELELEGRLKLELPNEKVWVRGDKIWLKRALLNLSRNAVVHSLNQQLPKSEAISQAKVRAALICPEASGPAAQLTMAVREDELIILTSNLGEIPKHLQASLFRRFVTTRGDRGGTGLGLAIARAVAEAHGGSLSLSQAGPPQVQFELKLPLSGPSTT